MMTHNLIAKKFSQQAKHYLQHANIQQMSGTELYSQLPERNNQDLRILDLGCGTGLFTKKLAQDYPKATVIGLDLAPGMVTVAQHQHQPILLGNAEDLPFDDQYFDVIFSNLMLQWLIDPSQALQECLRVLAPGGKLLATTFGQDTLARAKVALASINRAHNINPFHDIRAIGDLLMTQDWHSPVLYQETQHIPYPSASEVFQNLRHVGANTMLDPKANKTLLTRKIWQTCLDHYPKSTTGDIIASYQVIYLFATKPQTTQMTEADGSVSVDIRQIKKKTNRQKHQNTY